MVPRKLLDPEHHLKWFIAAMLISQLLMVLGVAILIWLYLQGRLV